MWDREFSEDKAGAEVDVDGVVPFVEADVEDIACPLAVACVDDEDIWVMAVSLFDLVEETV